MHIAFVADGRSENFRRWVRYFVAENDEVTVLSTYPCDDITNCCLLNLPSIMRASNVLVRRSDSLGEATKQKYFGRKLLTSSFSRLLFPMWNIIKTINLLPQVVAARRMLRKLKPDIVVAFRTQNEGYVAAFAGFHPWVLFTQGSDFIYMADCHRLHAWLTAIAVRRADALLADCDRDIGLAKQYGFSETRPALLSPGNGGVDTAIYAPGRNNAERERLVVYPRGLAPYMRLDTLLYSIASLQKDSDFQDVYYKLLVTPAVISEVEAMIHRLHLMADKIDILPFMSQAKLASLLQRAAIIVSPSLTDGTPNSMLEAMACGAFPVMSNLESIREWICDGENGLLFDPHQPQELTTCLKIALANKSLREQAQDKNLAIIYKRAVYQQVMPKVRQFLMNISTTTPVSELSIPVSDMRLDTKIAS